MTNSYVLYSSPGDKTDRGPLSFFMGHRIDSKPNLPDNPTIEQIALKSLQSRLLGDPVLYVSQSDLQKIKKMNLLDSVVDLTERKIVGNPDKRK